jgi:Uma2 family endonuclease
MATVEKLLTAEEFLLLPSDNDRPMELVRGRPEEMNMPFARHGQLCARVSRLLGNFADEKDLGHVLTNDSGVITERNPDTVRGADVAFCSYEDIPKGRLPASYLDKPLRLVIEVMSPSDRWSEVLAKVAEYVKVGVEVVCVLDPDEDKAYLHTSDRPVQILGAEDAFQLPDLLPGFAVRVKIFFE